MHVTLLGNGHTMGGPAVMSSRAACMFAQVRTEDKRTLRYAAGCGPCGFP
jgi:hypothetical protein